MQQTQDPVIAKLEQLEGRFVEIERQVIDPAVSCDMAKVIPLSKEQGKLRPTVERYREYRKCLTELEQARQMEADSGGDPELRQMAREELDRLTPLKTRLYEDIRDSLVMSDDTAIDSVILEIRAGTGGEEAALFARDLYNMYTRYAESQGLENRTAGSYSPSDMGGLREVVAQYRRPRRVGAPRLRRRRPPRSARARNRSPGPHPHLRGDGGGSARARRGRCRYQTRGCRRAGLPCRRSRRPERQQGRQRHPPGTRSHRHHRQHAGRTQPAQKPRQGLAHPPQPHL